MPSLCNGMLDFTGLLSFALKDHAWLADATHAGVTVENAIELLTQLELNMFGVTVSSLEDRKARQQEAFDKAIINPFFIS